MKKKLLIVANRLPVRFERTEAGLKAYSSEGGLATGLASLYSDYEKAWIGWPGLFTGSEEEQNTIKDTMDEIYHPVFLTEEEIDQYYKGFSNETLWPLSHYFMEHTRFSETSWEHYQAVNRKFCEKVLEVAEEGDLIWVHDYHLMLLPALLKEALGDKNPLGFFLHIPFPSFELFRTLPWKKTLLEGLLGADLVGFHTLEYAQNFSNTVSRVLGHENRLGAIYADGHICYIDVFPMGINYDKFNSASESPEVVSQVKAFRKRFGEVKLMLSVDRLDYTKGIPNRLRAFNEMLTQFPELKSEVSLIMLAVPSRDDIGQYIHLKEEVDEIVGSINGKHSTLVWTPVHYFYRSIPFEQLVALYSLADIGIVTPVRDGMNLVAKEYVASKNRGKGVLILSEMAGSALEMDGALLVNPNNEKEMVEAFYTALHMSKEEQSRRLSKMRAQLRAHSVEKWGAEFTSQLETIYATGKKIQNKIMNSDETAEICADFSHAEKRLILLDYDGTLQPFCNNPYDAKPDPELKELLAELSRHATVVILSGRDHFVMEEWLGDLDVHLVAEHGIWCREEGDWKQTRGLSSAWKSEIYPIISAYVEKTPGAFIEEKPFSLVFHYRQSESWMAEVRPAQLIGMLMPVCEKNQLNILDGNKVIEVRVNGIDKGSAAKKWLNDSWDFILGIGDDVTDEDLFAALPDTAYSIKVGAHHSKAKWRIRNCEKVRELLKQLVGYNALHRQDKSMRLIYKKAV